MLWHFVLFSMVSEDVGHLIFEVTLQFGQYFMLVREWLSASFSTQRGDKEAQWYTLKYKAISTYYII
jgi:hypothetical protein